jgi:tRNA1(Val) A37 N6-methylase TrmN6
MEFDCILANPPYQDPNGTNKLYHQFFELSNNLITDKGTIGFICPSSFVYRTGQKNKVLRELTKGKMPYLDLSASLHFPRVGDDICAFVTH